MCSIMLEQTQWTVKNRFMRPKYNIAIMFLSILLNQRVYLSAKSFKRVWYNASMCGLVNTEQIWIILTLYLSRIYT